MNRKSPIVAATLLTALTAALVGAGSEAQAAPLPTDAATKAKPTIVLVHGAFADSSSWNREIRDLRKAGYPVVAVANPLRGLPEDTAYLDSVLDTIKRPVVLVGHSYAGMVTSAAAADSPNVKALVYVAAFIPKKGESAAALNTKFPGSQLVNENFVIRPAPAGGVDIYLKEKQYGKVYANGLSKLALASAAVTQRPITQKAFTDSATEAAPADLPKWAVVATQDHAVPTKLQRYMAKRAHAKVLTAKSGHDVPAVQPKVVERAILAAARSVK